MPGMPERRTHDYDLARPRRTGLIEGLGRTNTYVLTADGQRVAVSYARAHDRLLRPLLAAHEPPAPAELRHAQATIDRRARDHIDNARLGTAA